MISKENACNTDLLPRLVFDAQALAQIGRAVVGDRTIQKFCQETALSRSLVSRLLNGTLKQPPTVRTILRFTENDRSVAEKMLFACGYPQGVIDHLFSIPKLRSESESQANVTFAKELSLRPASGLEVMINALDKLHCDCNFSIDYNSGVFAIHEIASHTIVGIPAFCSDESQVDSKENQAVQSLSRSLTIWTDINTCFFIITNNTKLFSILKELPNLDYKLAVLLTTDGQGFRQQHVIAPYGVKADKWDDFVKKFPVNFVQEDNRVCNNLFEQEIFHKEATL